MLQTDRPHGQHNTEQHSPVNSIRCDCLDHTCGIQNKKSKGPTISDYVVRKILCMLDVAREILDNVIWDALLGIID